ncbi:RNA-binding domain-containing protein [Polychaeton citri CBS 116435]|uniref:RNA-binding domain-containing protein n=1 Tax=Polychaeton citri CBS 116435 TaxID=1314669 RepID=A0A9P4PWN2_9PEZI|nr:RNA-binding domain-containing protein [Polychaeton citri CBS 116435]
MDRSLDEIIGDRPRGGRGPSSGRRPPPRPRRDREEGPRDGVRKFRRDEPSNIDSDWVHDRYEDDRHDRRPRPQRGYDDASRYESDARQPPPREEGGKLKVDNIHYELTEDDLRELFHRVGPTTSVRLLYDRYNRSQGTAYVTYADYRDARDAVANFDGQNANGQPIYITLLPSAPRGGGSSFDKERSLFARVEQPGRSLFDRVDRDAADADVWEDSRRRRRSMSPRVHDGIDRYIPGAPRRRAASRSPVRRRGTPREGGRRPGERSQRGGRRGGPKPDEEGRPPRGGRPRKTAEELDAEMADYFGKEQDKGNGAQNGGGASTATIQNEAGAAPEIAMDDTDMVG